MLGGESVIEFPQALLAETKVNMEGVKHHSVNVIGVAPFGFHELTIDFHVHRFSLGGAQNRTEYFAASFPNPHVSMPSKKTG